MLLSTISPWSHSESSIAPVWLPSVPTEDADAAVNPIWPKLVSRSGRQWLSPEQLAGASAIHSAALVSGTGDCMTARLMKRRAPVVLSVSVSVTWLELTCTLALIESPGVIFSRPIVTGGRGTSSYQA